MGKSRKFDSEDFDSYPATDWNRNRREARKHKESQRASVFSRDEDDFSIDKNREKWNRASLQTAR